MKKQTHSKLFYIFVGILIYVGGILSGIYGKNLNEIVPMPTRPTVSVLMPTYNRADVLSGAIDSILNQSFKNFEFIIVDDGSTDNTAEVIKKYAKKDKRIVYVKNEKNSGIVYGLNNGLKRAKGKYIARMDDDDYAYVGRLERQVRAMEEHPEITILGAQIGFNPDTTISQTSPEIENPKKVEIRTYFSSGLAHPTILIRRDFLMKKGITYSEKYKYAEDCNLYKDVLNAGGLISVVKEPLLKFKAAKKPKRASQYDGVQYESFKGLQREKLERLGMQPDETLLGSGKEGRSRCMLLSQMQAVNGQKRLLNTSFLAEITAESCPPDINNAISVVHPYWKDFFVRDGNKIIRFSNKDTAQIINETPTSVTIKWDKWDGEIYTKKDAQTFVYKQDVNGEIKK